MVGIVDPATTHPGDHPDRSPHHDAPAFRACPPAHRPPGSRLHDEGEPAVVIEDDAFIGPDVTILPNVTIGRGAVVTAGSVVSRSVPPLTMVQGVPARPVARCGVALGMRTPLKEFYRQLRPIRPASKTHDGPGRQPREHRPAR